MTKIQLILLMWGSLLFSVHFCSTIAIASSESSFKNMEIKITPLPNKVAVGFPLDMSDEYYFVKSISRIFFLDQTVDAKIIDVDIDNNKMELTIENKKYGKGVIEFVSTKNLEDASDDELKKLIQRSLSDDKLSLVVVDSKSKIFHLATCNHSPQTESRLYVNKDVALESGHKSCGVCFRKLMYLPDVGLEIELQKKMGSALRYDNAPLIDFTMQSRVDRLGKKVLDNWPYPLIGYHYKFTVVESRDINAFALPAGSIFLTSGMINAVENDDELEAVLAHEISHVERRHSLKSYKRLVAKQQAQATLAVIGGIATGVASAKGQGGVAIGAAGVTLASILAIELQQTGYSKEHEEEADNLTIRYFMRLKRDLQPVKSVFKKLMYNNLCIKQDPDPDSLTHPALSNRIFALGDQKVIFPEPVVYHIVRNEEPIELQVLSIAFGNDSSEVVFRVSNLSTLKSFLKDDGKIRLIKDSKVYEYDPEDDNYTFIDSWNGIVTAKSKNTELAVFNYNDLEIEDFEKDPNYGYPISKKLKLIKGPYY